MPEGIKTDNFFKNWMIDRIYGTVNEDAQGNLNAGPIMGTVGSLLNFNVDSIEDQKGIDVGNKDAKATMRQLGETYESLGFKEGQNLTGEAVIARRKKREEEKEKEKLTDERKYRDTIRSDDREHANDTLAAQLKANSENNATSLAQQTAQHTATLQSQQNQFAHTSEQNALQRRHDMERGDKRDSLSLQMQVMQNDLAEKRMDYDRETRRMDKRTAAIAQLMSGLGSLGGAFAL